ncbi:MAG TPA: desulfoferrodoxin [Methanobacteriales archaeon]|nr:MAG: Superoxide reductase [Methanobacteriaceae archaeon 41_258]MBC7090182.1 desulfoferrodoxin [Methanobacteriaceae archaeon]MDI3484284.1 superoxide reductase [Methanobacteriaceae archaeon]HIH62174.1 desulfoferrodoxin [Methanobacteriales archaeon]
MTTINQIFRCNICGNIVEILNPGEGRLVCCGQPMELLLARHTDIGPEKHIPMKEKVEEGLKVKVGETPHPMEENHHIQWIEVILDNKVLRKTLKPGDKPEATFQEKPTKKIMVRSYCNIHGLWHD